MVIPTTTHEISGNISTMSQHLYQKSLAELRLMFVDLFLIRLQCFALWFGDFSLCFIHFAVISVQSCIAALTGWQVCFHLACSSIILKGFPNLGRIPETKYCLYFCLLLAVLANTTHSNMFLLCWNCQYPLHKAAFSSGKPFTSQVYSNFRLGFWVLQGHTQILLLHRSRMFLYLSLCKWNIICIHNI